MVSNANNGRRMWIIATNEQSRRNGERKVCVYQAKCSNNWTNSSESKKMNRMNGIYLQRWRWCDDFFVRSDSVCIFATLLWWHTKNNFVFIYIFLILSLLCAFIFYHFLLAGSFFIVCPRCFFFRTHCIIVRLWKKSLMKKSLATRRRRANEKNRQNPCDEIQNRSRYREFAPFSKVSFGWNVFEEREFTQNNLYFMQSFCNWIEHANPLLLFFAFVVAFLKPFIHNSFVRFFSRSDAFALWLCHRRRTTIVTMSNIYSKIVLNFFRVAFKCIHSKYI